MPIRRDACVLCQTGVERSAPGPTGFRICGTCDLAWSILDDPLAQAEDWDRSYYGKSTIVEMHRRRQSAMESIARRLSAARPERGLLLDAGAGLGNFMLAAGRQGWSVEGAEISPTAAENARALTGARVHVGLLEKLPLPESAYDVVTTLDVLRTVVDPLAFLLRARRLLRPGGLLMVREINREAERRYHGLSSSVRSRAQGSRLAFEYGQCFSPRSILFALKAAGYDEGWVEPSPIFIEAEAGAPAISSVLKRLLGAGSDAVYWMSRGKLVISPNMLAFGRVPDGSNRVSPKEA